MTGTPPSYNTVAKEGWVEFVKLLLDIAGDNRQDLMKIKTRNPYNEGKTAFDIATREVKEAMKQYLHNNQ